MPPAALIGGAFIVYGSRFLMADMALVVEELQEEAGERRRIAEGASVPVLQARNLDVSYGSVQVLFDCAIDVHQGEAVALLGTNGAGKSTLLRALLGLTPPDRGVVRLRGRSITYADAEYRFGKGIVAVRGGDGVFAGLSVADNLALSFTATSVPGLRAQREDPAGRRPLPGRGPADAASGPASCPAASASSSPSPGRSSTTPTSSSSTSSRSGWPPSSSSR